MKAGPCLVGGRGGAKGAPTILDLLNSYYSTSTPTQLQAGAEFFPRAISCTQATQTDSINSIASAG